MRTRPIVRRRFAAAAAPVAVPLALILAPPTGAERAGATLLVYEPFDYAANTVLEGQTATGLNLTGAYASNVNVDSLQPRAVSPGLTYGSLTGAPAPAGVRLSQNVRTTAATATASVDQDVPTGPGTAIYFSALFTLDDSLNGNHLASVALVDADTGDEVRFGEAAVGSGGVRISATTAATNATHGGTIAAGADNAFTDGHTLLLIGRYTNGAAAGTDAIELVGYDTADAVALPAGFSPGDANAHLSYALSGVTIDLAKVSAVSFTIRGTANNFIDELRVGTTYAAIVPEPAAAPLILGLAGAGILARPRRRQRP
jgi:hypothetical protein